MHVTTELILTGAVLGIGAYILMRRLLATFINAVERIGDTLADKFSRRRGKSSMPPPPPASRWNTRNE
jgi:hypothetical protein